MFRCIAVGLDYVIVAKTCVHAPSKPSCCEQENPLQRSFHHAQLINYMWLRYCYNSMLDIVISPSIEIRVISDSS
jgi:hypothetical protein